MNKKTEINNVKPKHCIFFCLSIRTNIKDWNHSDLTLWQWCALNEVDDMKVATILPLLVYVLAGKSDDFFLLNLNWNKPNLGAATD